MQIFLVLAGLSLQHSTKIKLTKKLNLDCSAQFLRNKSKSLMDTINIKRSYVYM